MWCIEKWLYKPRITKRYAPEAAIMGAFDFLLSIPGTFSEILNL
jgi:hypothetical protein